MLEPSDRAPLADAGPRANIAAEAQRILNAAGVGPPALYLIGGLAIELLRPVGHAPLLSRSYRDIDFVTVRSDRQLVGPLMETLGYLPDRDFNVINGRRRLLYLDSHNDRQVDIFVEDFEMCHKVPVLETVDASASTIPLAELLLTKLQIVELNEKDQRDIVNLLFHHKVCDGARSSDVIDAKRVAHLCAVDWGLWRTTTLNLERTAAALSGYPLAHTAKETVIARVRQLSEALTVEPKSRRWRLRAQLGDRVRWYEEPEEVRD